MTPHRMDPPRLWFHPATIAGAHMTERHLTGCTGKRRYDRFSVAKTMADRTNRQHDDAHVEPYHCRHCDGYHTGESRTYRHRKAKGVER